MTKDKFYKLSKNVIPEEKIGAYYNYLRDYSDAFLIPYLEYLKMAKYCPDINTFIEEMKQLQINELKIYNENIEKIKKINRIHFLTPIQQKGWQ